MKDNSINQNNRYVNNPIDSCLEVDDIIQKLENMNFSAEKSSSFDSPFTSKQKNQQILQEKTKNKIEEDIPTFFKDNFIKSKNSSNELNLNENQISKEKQELINSQKIALKYKINRISILIQKFSINQKISNKFDDIFFKVSEFNNIAFFTPFNETIDIFFEILKKLDDEFSIKNNLIKQLNESSLLNEQYINQINKLKMELITKTKPKSFDISSSIIKENKKLKQENVLLLKKYTKYKNQFIKSNSDYLSLHEKYLQSQKDKEKGKENLNINKKNYYQNKKTNDNSKKDPNETISYISVSLRNSSSNIFKNKKENLKIKNDENSLIKKLTTELINLLLKINKMIYKFDSNLNKINPKENSILFDIYTLSSNIDIKFLKNEINYKTFIKNFISNMDIINNKIISINNLKKNPSKKIINKTNQSVSISNYMSSAKKLKFCSKKTSRILRKTTTSTRKGFSYLNIYGDNEDLDSMDISKNSTVCERNKKNLKNKIFMMEKSAELKEEDVRSNGCKN